jgi:hypothetical protein
VRRLLLIHLCPFLIYPVILFPAFRRPFIKPSLMGHHALYPSFLPLFFFLLSFIFFIWHQLDDYNLVWTLNFCVDESGAIFYWYQRAVLILLLFSISASLKFIEKKNRLELSCSTDASGVISDWPQINVLIPFFVGILASLCSYRLKVTHFTDASCAIFDRYQRAILILCFISFVDQPTPWWGLLGEIFILPNLDTN